MKFAVTLIPKPTGIGPANRIGKPDFSLCRTKIVEIKGETPINAIRFAFPEQEDSSPLWECWSIGKDTTDAWYYLSKDTGREFLVCALEPMI